MVVVGMGVGGRKAEARKKISAWELTFVARMGWDGTGGSWEGLACVWFFACFLFCSAALCPRPYLLVIIVRHHFRCRFLCVPIHNKRPRVFFLASWRHVAVAAAVIHDGGAKLSTPRRLSRIFCPE